jgi:hypothetical protein
MRVKNFRFPHQAFAKNDRAHAWSLMTRPDIIQRRQRAKPQQLDPAARTRKSERLQPEETFGLTRGDDVCFWHG